MGVTTREIKCRKSRNTFGLYPLEVFSNHCRREYCLLAESGQSNRDPFEATHAYLGNLFHD